MRLFKRILLVVGAPIAGLLVLAAVRIGPRNIFGMLRYGPQRQAGSLKVGDRAPDVTLVSLDGKASVRLADAFGEKPLVLVFGSFT